jgi:hypothetical protein
MTMDKAEALHSFKFRNMRHIFILGVCTLIFLIHVWLGWKICDWSWISRSGASIVVVGVLLEAWKVLIIARADDMPFWQSQEGHTALRYSVIIICFGTVIQGYADLPFRLLSCG